MKDPWGTNIEMTGRTRRHQVWLVIGQPESRLAAMIVSADGASATRWQFVDPGPVVAVALKA